GCQGQCSPVMGAVIFSQLLYCSGRLRDLHSFPTRRSSDLRRPTTFYKFCAYSGIFSPARNLTNAFFQSGRYPANFPRRRSLPGRSEEHTSELQSLAYLVCRLLLEKKNHIQLTTPDSLAAVI